MYSVSMVSPEKSKDMLYRDDYLIIQFKMNDPGIRFQVQNISPYIMRIDWVNATIGVNGIFSPVRTMSTFYDTTARRPATLVLRSLGVVRDVILPRGNTYFDGAKWRVEDLLPTTDANTLGTRNTIRSLVGSSIEIQFAVKSGPDFRPYAFSLAVDSVGQISWNNYRPAPWLPTAPPVKGLQTTPQNNLTAVIIAGGFMGFLRYMMTLKKDPVIE
jgi:hypothetical protein